MYRVYICIEYIYMCVYMYCKSHFNIYTLIWHNIYIYMWGKSFSEISFITTLHSLCSKEYSTSSPHHIPFINERNTPECNKQYPTNQWTDQPTNKQTNVSFFLSSVDRGETWRDTTGLPSTKPKWWWKASISEIHCTFESGQIFYEFPSCRPPPKNPKPNPNLPDWRDHQDIQYIHD